MHTVQYLRYGRTCITKLKVFIHVQGLRYLPQTRITDKVNQQSYTRAFHGNV